MSINAVVVLLASHQLSHAQNEFAQTRDNIQTLPYSVRISIGNSYLKDVGMSRDGVQQIGARISRNFGSHLRAEVGYSKMFADMYQDVPRRASDERYFIPAGQGIIADRLHYKMFDLNLSFPFRFSGGRHTIQPGLAGTYCWGTNQISLPYGPAICTSNGLEDVSYLGLAPNLSYYYTLLKGRFSIGAEYMLRSYSGRPQIQHDASLTAAINF